MVLAALLLMCAIPQMDDTAKVISDTNAAAERSTPPAVASENTAKDASAAAVLPSAPTPKVKADVEPIVPSTSAQPFQPIRPVFTRPRETPRQRKMWYALVVAGHSGATFDAWSTKRAVTGGYGQESNPFLRPFAHSNAIYAATQVSPAFMDFLGKRMMVSQERWLRRLWWVPQVAGAGFSFAAGAHNVGVVH
jgi:hypothetical protein